MGEEFVNYRKQGERNGLRFGPIWVDSATHGRRLKASARWYRDFVRKWEKQIGQNH